MIPHLSSVSSRRKIKRNRSRRIGSSVVILSWTLWITLALTASAEPPTVTITSPPAGQPAFGDVELSAEIVEGEAVIVRFLFDGRVVGELESPPYQTTVDAGQENRPHRFEVQAISADGEVGTALMVTPAIRIDDEIEAELQQLYVTVTRQDQRILDLEQEDFRIYDDQFRQQIVTFARGDVRLTAALLIDSSTSMKGRRLRFALRGATAFLSGLREIDDASLLLFADRLLYSTPFSNDVATLTEGLSKANATGGTSLNDHLYLALKKLESRQGRRVVIVLSDGIDSHSSLRMADVFWLARRSRALIYWIRINPGGGDPTKRLSAWKNPETYKEEYRLLTRTVESSGGRIVDLDNLQAAEDAFQGILDELREQYVIGYYPSSSRNDGSWHDVRVEVDGGNLNIRAQKGYVDY